VLTERDIAYVRDQFVRLEDLGDADELRARIDRGELPRPAYVLPDGSEWVPRDYLPGFERAELERRYLEACRPWEAYLDGAYQVCLRRVTPEAIARKDELVAELALELLEPRPADPEWRARVRDAVDELDALERPFSPDYDRTRFGRPPTRDLLVARGRLLLADVG